MSIAIMVTNSYILVEALPWLPHEASYCVDILENVQHFAVHLTISFIDSINMFCNVAKYRLLYDCGDMHPF